MFLRCSGAVHPVTHRVRRVLGAAVDVLAPGAPVVARGFDAVAGVPALGCVVPVVAAGGRVVGVPLAAAVSRPWARSGEQPALARSALARATTRWTYWAAVPAATTSPPVRGTVPARTVPASPSVHDGPGDHGGGRRHRPGDRGAGVAPRGTAWVVPVARSTGAVAALVLICVLVVVVVVPHMELRIRRKGGPRVSPVRPTGRRGGLAPRRVWCGEAPRPRRPYGIARDDAPPGGGSRCGRRLAAGAARSDDTASWRTARERRPPAGPGRFVLLSRDIPR